MKEKRKMNNKDEKERCKSTVRMCGRGRVPIRINEWNDVENGGVKQGCYCRIATISSDQLLLELASMKFELCV